MVIKWKCEDTNTSQVLDRLRYMAIHKVNMNMIFHFQTHNLHISQYYRILYIITKHYNITALPFSEYKVSTLSSAFETRVYPYALGYMGAPWQLCLFENCEYIIDN